MARFQLISTTSNRFRSLAVRTRVLVACSAYKGVDLPEACSAYKSVDLPFGETLQAILARKCQTGDEFTDYQSQRRSTAKDVFMNKFSSTRHICSHSVRAVPNSNTMHRTILHALY